MENRAIETGLDFPKLRPLQEIQLTYLQLLMPPKGPNGKLRQKEIDELRHWPLRQRFLH